MPDVFTTPIKILGDAGKILRFSFNYQIKDSQTQTSILIDRGEDQKDYIIFPDVLDTLADSERIDLYYHIQNWSFISASFTQYLIELILLKIPNNYTDQLNLQRQHILPGYLKKAQKYIQDHLEQPISLADLSQCCEVSIRTLQKGFSQYLQQTPVEYIRDQRLERVHLALQQAQTNETVTDIVLRHGFQSLGHFSTLYKKRYGCVPSKTLKMSPVQMSTMLS